MRQWLNEHADKTTCLYFKLVLRFRVNVAPRNDGADLVYVDVWCVRIAVV